MKKKSIIKVLGILLSVLCLIPVFTISCDNDENGDEDPLVGKYTFTSATFNDTVNVKVDGIYKQFLPDSAASQFVRNGILKAAPCDNIANAAVDLRSNGQNYYICLGETNEEQMGTWVINSERTILTFNISNPQSLALIIADLVISETQFDGTVENFPFVLDNAYELGDSLSPGLYNFQIASVDVKFSKVE
ncbi:MAG: hypothetical protein ISS19_14460 [Bacteroidales bacterium]|nr:hypothetical protein [Bacteroidales bacterium]